MATTTDTVLSMKLLVDRKAGRVLFAEASKEVVDFLFALLVFPVATVVKLVGKDAMVGCAGNLYASVEKLDSTYVQAGAAKDAILCPAVLSSVDGTANCSLLRLPAQPSSTSPSKTFYNYSYQCEYGCNNYVTDVSGTRCPSCRKPMTEELNYVAPASGVSGHRQKQDVANGGAKGFVQGIVTYTVMDNLTISPMSSISSITLFNTFAVRDIGDLEEKTVQLGYKEGLSILKACLQSKTVLTDVFLGKKQASGRAVPDVVSGRGPRAGCLHQ